MLNFIFALIAGVITGCAAFYVSAKFGESLKCALLRTGIIVALITLIGTIAPKVPVWLAMMLFIVVLAMAGYLIYWWLQNGSTIKEFFAFVLMLFWVLLIARACGIRIYDVTSIGWLIGIIMSIPTIVFLMSIGCMVADMIWFHENLKTGKRG